MLLSVVSLLVLRIILRCVLLYVCFVVMILLKICR